MIKQTIKYDVLQWCKSRPLNWSISENGEMIDFKMIDDMVENQLVVFYSTRLLESRGVLSFFSELELESQIGIFENIENGRLQNRPLIRVETGNSQPFVVCGRHKNINDEKLPVMFNSQLTPSLYAPLVEWLDEHLMKNGIEIYNFHFNRTISPTLTAYTSVGWYSNHPFKRSRVENYATVYNSEDPSVEFNCEVKWRSVVKHFYSKNSLKRKTENELSICNINTTEQVRHNLGIFDVRIRLMHEITSHIKIEEVMGYIKTWEKDNIVTNPHNIQEANSLDPTTKNTETLSDIILGNSEANTLIEKKEAQSIPSPESIPTKIMTEVREQRKLPSAMRLIEKVMARRYSVGCFFIDVCLINEYEPVTCVDKQLFSLPENSISLVQRKKVKLSHTYTSVEVEFNSSMLKPNTNYPFKVYEEQWKNIMSEKMYLSFTLSKLCTLLLEKQSIDIDRAIIMK